MMRKEYDFSQAKSVKEIPHLQRLQMQFKTEVQIELDNDVIETLYKGKYLNKEQIIATLKNHQSNFKQLGVAPMPLS